MTENMLTAIVVGASITSVLVVLTLSLALFASSSGQSSSTGAEVLSSRFVEWRKIAAESDRARVLLKAQVELLSEKLAGVRAAHAKCPDPDCPTCRVLKS